MFLKSEEDITACLVEALKEVTELQAAFLHLLYRNHEHHPEGCSLCELIDIYANKLE